MFDNRRQTIPRLFQVIMDNQRRREELRAQGLYDFELEIEMRNLRRAAEEFLRRKGNTDGKI